MIIFNINNVLLIYRVQNNLKAFSVEINEISETFIKKFSLKKIKAKSYSDFHDLLQTFNLIKIEKLFFHRLYDYKIDFVDDFQTMQS